MSLNRKAISVCCLDEAIIEEARIEKEFKQFDKDGNGVLDKKEFIEWATKKGNFTKRQAKNTFTIIDQDHSLNIDSKEFIEFMKAGHTEEGKVKMAFNGFANENGELNLKTFSKFMKIIDRSIPFFKVKNVFKKYDADNSNSVTWKEVESILFNEL